MLPFFWKIDQREPISQFHLKIKTMVNKVSFFWTSQTEIILYLNGPTEIISYFLIIIIDKIMKL